jgi:hypothetical protein
VLLTSINMYTICMIHIYACIYNTCIYTNTHNIYACVYDMCIYIFVRIYNKHVYVTYVCMCVYIRTPIYIYII